MYFIVFYVFIQKHHASDAFVTTLIIREQRFVAAIEPRINRAGLVVLGGFRIPLFYPFLEQK
jgi:hypothetical protein